MVGVPVDPQDFDLAKIPDHLKITFRVTDERRRKLAESKDLESLQIRLKSQTQQALSKAFESSARAKADKAAKASPDGEPTAPSPEPSPAPALQRTGLTSWTLGTLPRTFETRRAGQPVKAYPALADEGDSVAVRLYDTEAEQRQAMWRGTRRLILLNIPSDPAKFAQSKLSNQQKLALSRSPHGSVQALFEDCVSATADRLVAAHGGPAWDEESFRKLFDAVRSDLVDATVRTVQQVQEVLAAWHSCEGRLRATTSPVLSDSVADVRAQLDALIKPGFVTEHGAGRLSDLMRYLVAADRRLQQLPHHVERDRTRMAKVHEMRDEYLWLLEQFPPGRPVPQAAREIRWMIEELRVSYFAHALGTAYPVSDKRIVKAVDAAAP
jgi:ATP-dependent helicase HrpA